MRAGLEGLDCGGEAQGLSRTALVATRKLEPDIEMAAISGRRTSPKASNTPGRDRV